MTEQEIIDRLVLTGRVKPIGETHHTGLIMPDGRFFPIRDQNATETHAEYFRDALGLVYKDVFEKFNFIRKVTYGNQSAYKFSPENLSAKALIEADLTVSQHRASDTIYIQRADLKRSYIITYGEFEANSFLLNNPQVIKTTLF